MLLYKKDQDLEEGLDFPHFPLEPIGIRVGLFH